MKRNKNDWKLFQKFGLKYSIVRLETNINDVVQFSFQNRISTAFPNWSYNASTMPKKEPINCTYSNAIHENIVTRIKDEKLYKKYSYCNLIEKFSIKESIVILAKTNIKFFCTSQEISKSKNEQLFKNMRKILADVITEIGSKVN